MKKFTRCKILFNLLKNYSTQLKCLLINQRALGAFQLLDKTDWLALFKVALFAQESALSAFQGSWMNQSSGDMIIMCQWTDNYFHPITFTFADDGNNCDDGIMKRKHIWSYTWILGWTNWSICVHFVEHGWPFAMLCVGLIGMSIYLVSTKPLWSPPTPPPKIMFMYVLKKAEAWAESWLSSLEMLKSACTRHKTAS